MNMLQENRHSEADWVADVGLDTVVEDKLASKILETSGLQPVAQHAALRGITNDALVYEIP